MLDSTPCTIFFSNCHKGYCWGFLKIEKRKGENREERRYLQHYFKSWNFHPHPLQVGTKGAWTQMLMHSIQFTCCVTTPIDGRVMLFLTHWHKNKQNSVQYHEGPRGEHAKQLWMFLFQQFQFKKTFYIILKYWEETLKKILTKHCKESQQKKKSIWKSKLDYPGTMYSCSHLKVLSPNWNRILKDGVN